MPGLIVDSVEEKGKRLELADEAIIGRDKENSFFIDDPRASRQNARVLKDPDGYYVIDLNSRNGTLVNGEKVTRRKLKDNDRITIGRTVIVYLDSLANAPAAASSTEETQKPQPGSFARTDAATADLSSGVKAGLPVGPDLGKSKELIREMAKLADKSYSPGEKSAPSASKAKQVKWTEPEQAKTTSFSSKILLFLGLLVFFLALLFLSKWAGEKFISSIASRSAGKTPPPATEPNK
jgi:pSer/pThr/pTyr-binding forkhead associated (FHA) protein